MCRRRSAGFAFVHQLGGFIARFPVNRSAFVSGLYGLAGNGVIGRKTDMGAIAGDRSDCGGAW